MSGYIDVFFRGSLTMLTNWLVRVRYWNPFEKL